LVNGETVFEWSDFTKAIQSDDNWVILLDETTRAGREVINGVLGLLDGSQTVRVQDQLIKVNTRGTKIIIASENIGREYGGLKTIDKAFSNRFEFVIDKTYSPEVEKALLFNAIKEIGHPKFNNNVMSKMQKAISEIRARGAEIGVNDGSIFSTRTLVNIIKHLKTWAHTEESVNEAVMLAFDFAYIAALDATLAKACEDILRSHFN
jgi:MoxR-like ATPase